MKSPQFFSDVSHELRTHLALILGPAEALLTHGHNLTGVQRRDLDVMRRNAVLLLRHIDDLLDITRVGVGRMTLAYAEVELASLVREVARHFEPLALQRHLSFAVDAPTPVSIQVDVEKLERVVLHLLSHAFKSIPEGGRVRLSVGGIPGERALLEVEASGAEGTQGVGSAELGMSFVRDFVELHGGLVRVTEVPGGGALFQVELPCQAPAETQVTRRAPEKSQGLEAGLALRSTLEELIPLAEEHVQASVAARTDDTADTSRPSVLVVKNSAELHRFMVEALQEDYRVISAFDGQEALEKARSLRPDLILTGIQLPHLSGNALVAALRQEESLERVPIVVLSTRDDEALKLKLLREGAQDYLVKPFSAEEVRVRVRNLVQLKRAREELERRNLELERLRVREEAHYRAILDTSPAVIYVKDLQGRYLLVNRAFESFLRRSREDILGRADDQLYSPELAAVFRRNDVEVLRRGVPVELEELAPHVDGLHVYWSIKFPLMDTSGRIYALGGISTDITLQKRAEEERERFFTLAPDMFCIAGLDARFRRVNPAFTRVLGWSEEELLAQPFMAFVHPEDRERTVQELADIEQGSHAFHFENRYQCKDGTWRWLSWRSSPATSEGVVYAAARDITVQREVQEAVRQLNQELEQRVKERTRQLEEANRELESFSYTVSHDLRAPLRHITGFVELLERHARGGLDAKAQGYLRTIAASAQRGGQLVDDLLAFSRMGRVEMRQSRIQLESLVAEVWDELAPEREGRQIVLEVGPMPEARGDPAMLKLVFKNLLGNAVKYTRPRAEARVEVTAETLEGSLVIHVKDNGVGFDMAYEDKLFGVFQRLHRASEFEGTGIGLAHVRRIITRHGGHTWGKGALGQGATFSFSLPTAPST